jgi:outer membrane protein assembly factor BamB
VWFAEGGGTTATLARDTVVVAGPFDLTGLGVADGAPRWTFAAAAVAAPVAVGGWAVVADEAGVTALGAASGRPRWRRDAVGVRALAAGPAWTVAAWDGVMADVIDVPSGERAARFRSDVPPVALPCGWAVVEAGVAGCYRW